MNLSPLNTLNKRAITKNKSSSNSETSNKNSDDEQSNKSKVKVKKEEKQTPQINKLIFNERFEIQDNYLLGRGSFGEIYVAKDFLTRSFIALKLEKQKSKQNQLKTEKLVLDTMVGIEGFPRVFCYGTQHDNNFLAMELLGPNISDLFEFCKHKFSLQTVLLIAIQVITRIQDLHSKNFIHRDIKPENFLIGNENNSDIIYCIDYGLARKYKDSKMDNMPYKENKTLIGTARYASINNHLGIEQSRRDDLESIGYLIIYLIKKRLPWQGCQGSTKNEKYNKILEKKLSISTESLCRDLPIEFSIYLNYVKNLKYNERPDYNFLKGLFFDLLSSRYSEKYIYDWCISNIVDEAPNLKIDFSNSNSLNLKNTINKKQEGSVFSALNNQSQNTKGLKRSPTLILNNNDDDIKKNDPFRLKHSKTDLQIIKNENDNPFGFGFVKENSMDNEDNDITMKSLKH